MGQVAEFRERGAIPAGGKLMKSWTLVGLDGFAAFFGPVAGRSLERSEDWEREDFDNLSSARLTSLTRLEYKKNKGLHLDGMLVAVAGSLDRSPYWALQGGTPTCLLRNVKSPQIYSLGSCIEPKQKSGAA